MNKDPEGLALARRGSEGLRGPMKNINEHPGGC